MNVLYVLTSHAAIFLSLPSFNFRSYCRNSDKLHIRAVQLNLQGKYATDSYRFNVKRRPYFTWSSSLVFPHGERLTEMQVGQVLDERAAEQKLFAERLEVARKYIRRLVLGTTVFTHV